MSIMSVTTCCMSADDPPPTLPLFKAYAALLASTITNASRGRWASVASAVAARSTLSTVHNSACAELSSRCAPWPLPSQEKESHFFAACSSQCAPEAAPTLRLLAAGVRDDDQDSLWIGLEGQGAKDRAVYGEIALGPAPQGLGPPSQLLDGKSDGGGGTCHL